MRTHGTSVDSWFPVNPFEIRNQTFCFCRSRACALCLWVHSLSPRTLSTAAVALLSACTLHLSVPLDVTMLFSHPIGRDLHTDKNVDKLRRLHPRSCPHNILHNLLNGSFKRHIFCTAEPFKNGICQHGSHARPVPPAKQELRLAMGVVVPLGFGLSARVGDAEVFDACPACANDLDQDVACNACGLAFDDSGIYEADDAAHLAAARRTLVELGEEDGEEEEYEEEEEAWGEEAEAEEYEEEEYEEEEEEEEWQEEEEVEQEEYKAKRVRLDPGQASEENMVDAALAAAQEKVALLKRQKELETLLGKQKKLAALQEEIKKLKE